MNTEKLAAAIERAIEGETTVLLYPRQEIARHDFRQKTLEGVVVNLTDQHWRFPTGGRILFRSVSMQPHHLQGIHALIFFMDGAVFKASNYMMDFVSERNSMYALRRNCK